MEGLRGIAVAAAVAVCTLASAEITRFHGIQLDEQHKLMVAQENGQALVFLSARERVAGGPIERIQADGSTDKEFRVAQNEELLRVSVEVLRVAPPNNLSNPGLKYRVTIQGIGLEPDLVIMHEVGASAVRDVITTEFAKIGARAGGAYTHALRFAGPIVAGVLKESGKLPPELPLTIERSQVGRIRVSADSLSRNKLPAGRALNPLNQPESDDAPERSFGFNIPTAAAPETHTGSLPPVPQNYLPPAPGATPLAAPISPLGGTP